MSAPTASGKTLLGILGILNKLCNGYNSFIYLVPYNSIRDEKYNDFLEKFEGIDIIIKKGYKGLQSLQNGEANIVISNFSAFDRFSRNHPEFDLASFYIFDEIDTLGNDYFGPSIEGSIARLLRKGAFDLIAISATIPESSKLTEWFKADFFKSEYKPVEHHEEVIIVADHHEKICNFYLVDSQTKDKSMLVMIYNKPRVMSYAKGIADYFQKKGLTPLEDNNPMIKNIVRNISKTNTIKNLIECLKYRIAFHHSDLLNSTRNKITEYYNQDEIKIIVCTPTLLRGVNLKTRTVILPDPSIYIPKLRRLIPMPYTDYLQFKGRAGRPPYEDKAYVFIFSKDNTSKSRIETLYIHGEMEPLRSGFLDFKNRIVPQLLDKQILIELYNTDKSLEELLDVFLKYYFAVGITNRDIIRSKLEKRVPNLIKKRLLEKDIYGKFTTSIFGDEYLRRFEHMDISIEDFDKLADLSLDILSDSITFDDKFHFKIINRILGIIGSKNYINIKKRGANKEEIEENIRNILRTKCGIHTEIVNPHHITLVCLIEHLSHTSLENLDIRFGVDSTRLESIIKGQMKKFIDALINVILFLYDNCQEVYEEEIEIGDEFNNISCDVLTEFLNYIKVRIYYGVRFELYPIVTMQNIGNYRGISLYNALNNRFRDRDELNWKILEEIKDGLLKTEIDGWGKSLMNNLFDNLDGIISIENKMKKILKKFNIEYNVRK